MNTYGYTNYTYRSSSVATRASEMRTNTYTKPRSYPNYTTSKFTQSRTVSSFDQRRRQMADYAQKANTRMTRDMNWNNLQTEGINLWERLNSSRPSPVHVSPYTSGFSSVYTSDHLFADKALDVTQIQKQDVLSGNAIDTLNQHSDKKTTVSFSEEITTIETEDSLQETTDQKEATAQESKAQEALDHEDKSQNTDQPKLNPVVLERGFTVAPNIKGSGGELGELLHYKGTKDDPDRAKRWADIKNLYRDDDRDTESGYNSFDSCGFSSMKDFSQSKTVEQSEKETIAEPASAQPRKRETGELQSRLKGLAKRFKEYDA